MKTFNKPTNLNGAELKEELKAAGIIVDMIWDFADGTIGFNTNKKEAESIVAAHNGTTVAPEPTIEQKLASVGLNLGDLKAALGL
jgi:hypothetical protein